VKVEEGRNQIPFCVDEIKRYHLAFVYQPRQQLHKEESGRCWGPVLQYKCRSTA